jgi:chemotaxis signal transduction protein
MANGSLENISGLLIFQIANFEFCTDLKQVSAIMKPDEVKNNLGALTDFSYNFLNQDYLLIDFSNLYTLKVSSNNSSSRILFLEVFGTTISFYVDKVIEIISLDKIFIESSVDIQPSPGINYVGSVMSIQNRNFYFPDYEKIAKEPRRTNSEVK